MYESNVLPDLLVRHAWDLGYRIIATTREKLTLSKEGPGRLYYTIDLDFDMRQQVRFVTDGNDVLEFVVQLEIKIDDAWAWIRRYDTMNGFAHLDVKYGDGSIDKYRAMKPTVQ